MERQKMAHGINYYRYNIEVHINLFFHHVINLLCYYILIYKYFLLWKEGKKVKWQKIYGLTY